MAPPRLFHIAVLGPRGSGKTVFISSLFYASIQLPSHNFSASFLNNESEARLKAMIPPLLRSENDERSTQEFITNNWRNLFTDQEFGHIEGTLANWNLVLHLETRKGTREVIFYDIPGGWFSEEETWQDEKRRLKARMEMCDAAFLILDTLQIVHNDWEYGRHLHTFMRAIDEVYHDNQKRLPVALLFTKCDDPEVSQMPLEKLVDKVQGLINRLEVKGADWTSWHKRFKRLDQYQLFRVSAVGELVFDDSHPKGRPPQGGPVKNELFTNLSRALQFVLEFPERRARRVWKMAALAGLVLVAISLLAWNLLSYRYWTACGSGLERHLASPVYDLDVAAMYSQFSQSGRNWLYNLFHGRQIQQVMQNYPAIYARWDDELWLKIGEQYREGDDTISLAETEYQDWRANLGVYLRYFGKHQEKATHLYQLLGWKIAGCRLRTQEKQEDAKAVPQLLAEWHKIEANCPPLQEVAQKEREFLYEKQVSHVLPALQQHNFPEPFLGEMDKFLQKRGYDRMPARLFHLFEEKLQAALSRNQAEQTYDKSFALLQEIKSKIPGTIRIGQDGLNFGQFIDNAADKVKKYQDQEDYRQIKSYLAKNAKTLALDEQIRMWQEHLQKFQRLCQHRKEAEGYVQTWQSQQEEEAYQKIESWLNNGNASDYEGLLKKIHLLTGEYPNLSREILQRLEKLKEQTRRYEIDKDFQELEGLVKERLNYAQFAKAEQQIRDFSERWKLKYGSYPEAEEVVDKRAEPMRRDIRTMWRKYDYATIFAKFRQAHAMPAVEECGRLCTAFLREHGFDADVESGRKLVEKLAHKRKYNFKLTHGRHLQNSWLVANMSVHIYINEKKVFESKEYDTNTPTWNEAFLLEWQAFDQVEVRVLDTNGKNRYIYQDSAADMLSILVLGTTCKNHLVEIHFECPDSPVFSLPLPEQKQWK